MVTIKKYGNRRLYDSSSSRYINLDDLAKLIREGESVEVVDARTGENLTQAVLLQVLLETQGGFTGFPTGFLHRLIRYGGDNPMGKVFAQQLSLGMEMLDTQIAQFESRFPRPTPRAEPRSAPRDPEPPPDEPAPRPEHAAGEELSSLRERLAALEKKLKK